MIGMDDQDANCIANQLFFLVLGKSNECSLELAYHIEKQFPKRATIVDSLTSIFILIDLVVESGKLF